MFLDNLLNLLSKTISYFHQPVLIGNYSLSALSSKCQINTLSDGTVHIISNKESSLWFGLGFAMARDRLWQLEWMRRIATGTLAEILPQAETCDRITRVSLNCELNNKAL